MKRSSAYLKLWRNIMIMWAGVMSNGKKCIELGKGSLHIYYPWQTEVISVNKKPHWYFEGTYQIVDNNTILLIGDQGTDKDFVALSSKRKIYDLRQMQMFDVKYLFNGDTWNIMVF